MFSRRLFLQGRQAVRNHLHNAEAEAASPLSLTVFPAPDRLDHSVGRRGAGPSSFSRRGSVCYPISITRNGAGQYLATASFLPDSDVSIGRRSGNLRISKQPPFRSAFIAPRLRPNHFWGEPEAAGAALGALVAEAFGGANSFFSRSTTGAISRRRLSSHSRRSSCSTRFRSSK